VIKDNFAADRKVGDKMPQAYPDSAAGTRANRAFLGRAVRFLAGEAGIRQFLDVGTGIPSANNTHEAAQGVAPESRVGPAGGKPGVPPSPPSVPERYARFRAGGFHDRVSLSAVFAERDTRSRHDGQPEGS
jgi:hypothetical protein